MSKHTYKGQYFSLLDNSNEFECDWCGCNEYYLRGKLCVNLCDGCETLHITNRDICNEEDRAIMLHEQSLRKENYKNITVTHLESTNTLSVNLSPNTLADDKDEPVITYVSPYQKAKEINKKLINPVKLKHTKK